jgi:D-alanyl-D-alanine carboxypeptidase (penicillin-binding protein 5/6)
MKRIVKNLISVWLIFSLILPTVSTVSAEESKVDLAVLSKSAILMDRDTGTIMYEKNSDEKLPPASMTKIMTLLLIMEALESGKITFDEKVRASEYAASMGGSQIFLEEGEEMTVEDLLKGVAIASGNDASVALAERIAGSSEAFVNMMNERAKELGLKNTLFQNATGLPADDHYSTAKDMAIIAKELLKYDGITKFTGVYEDYLRQDTDDPFWLVNTNRLVKFYPGVDGLKTGYTSEAKYCLTATAKKDDMRVIAVVLGAPTPKERNRQITKMLDYAFNHYQTHPMYERNEVITDVKVSKGDKGKIDVITSENISLLTGKGENIENVEQEINLHPNIKAPLKKGEVVGTLILKKEEKILFESQLVASEDVNEASWWQLFKRTLGSFAQQ